MHPEQQTQGLQEVFFNFLFRGAEIEVDLIGKNNFYFDQLAIIKRLSSSGSFNNVLLISRPTIRENEICTPSPGD